MIFRRSTVSCSLFSPPPFFKFQCKDGRLTCYWPDCPFERRRSGVASGGGLERNPAPADW